MAFSFWLDHFLDSRAEIHQIFEMFFWKIKDTKKSFWDKLTFKEAIAAVFGAAPADDLGGRMYFATVLREALRSALIQDGLSRGLHETTKALKKGQALLCIKAENCNDDEYKKYVQALCEEHQIPFLTVPDNMHLGKYAGFCKLDDKGNKREVDQCSYIALKDWGKKGLTIDFVNKLMKQHQGKKFIMLFVLVIFFAMNNIHNMNY